MEKKRVWETPLYITIMALIVTVLFSEFLFEKNTILMASDQVNALGTKHLIEKTIVKDHQIPLWNTAILGGIPTIDAIAGDILYPPSIIMSHFFPTHKRIGMTMIFHIFLAGVMFYGMMRRGFGFPKYLAFIGGLFYLLNPMFFTHVKPGHDGKMYVIAWLPFVVWQLKLLLDNPTILRTFALSFGIGMSLLTAHVQLTYFVMWGIGAYWLVHTIRTLRVDRSPLKAAKGAGAFWAAIFIGVAFGATQLWPAFSFVKDAWSVRGTDKGIEFVASWSLHWAEAFSLWVPEFGNSLEYYWGDNPFKLNTEYAGAIAMVGAVLALVVRPTLWRFFWFGTALFTFLLAMGLHTPVLSFAYAVIPGVNKFRALSMIMFWFAFANVLLSLFFMKDVDQKFWENLSKESLARWKKGIGIAAIAVSVITLLALNSDLFKPIFAATSESFAQKEQIYEMNYRQNFIPALWGWWAMVITILGLLFFVITGKLKGQTLIYAMLLLGLVDTIRVNKQFIDIKRNRNLTHTPEAIRELQPKFKEAPFRIHLTEGTAHIESMAGLYEMEGINGFHDNELVWYRAFRGEQPTAQHEVRPGWYGRGMNFDVFHMGVDPQGNRSLNYESYAAGNPYLNVANCEYIVFTYNGLPTVIKNQNALPRIAFTQNYRVIDTTVRFDTVATEGGMAIRKTSVHERMNELFYTPGYDSRRTVLLEQKPSFESVDSSTIDPVIPVQWKTYTPNYRKAEVDVPADGLLRIAEVWYPGWEIRIDGKKVEPLRADIAWMAIEVSAGKKVIELAPKSLYLGTALKAAIPAWIATVVAGFAGLIMALLKRRRKK